MKNKWFKSVFIIYVLLTIADLISTIINYELIPFLEINTLYVKYGSFLIPLIINIIIPVVIYYIYNKTDNCQTRFQIILTLCFLIYIRIFVVIGNIQIYFADYDLEVVKQIATPEFKQEKIKEFAFDRFRELIVIFISFLSFWIFNKEHDIKKK